MALLPMLRLTSTPKLFPVVRALGTFVIAASPFFSNLTAHGETVEAYKWSVQYLIDQSQKVSGTPQTVFPRHNRAIALSPDGKFLYAGYHHSIDGIGEVRKIDLSQPDFVDATQKVLRGVRAKSICTDSKGRVYVATGEAVLIYDASLRDLLGQIGADACEGVFAVANGTETLLFTTERNEGTIRKWRIVSEQNGTVRGVAVSFGSADVISVPGAKSLRGVCVDEKGRILVADCDGGKIFRFDSNGGNMVSASLTTPIAIACDGVKVFVTQYTERQITIFEENLVAIGTLTVPWSELELSPVGNNAAGALSAIVSIPGHGFFVANEGGQTANQKSTYGRTDDSSALVNGKAYFDAQYDDNEPILRAVPITPP